MSITRERLLKMLDLINEARERAIGRQGNIVCPCCWSRTHQNAQVSYHHLVDERYQRIRLQRGTRKGFFQDLLALTKYLVFENWQHLLDFMLGDASPPTASHTS